MISVEFQLQWQQSFGCVLRARGLLQLPDLQHTGTKEENRPYAPSVRIGGRRWTRWWELPIIAHANGRDTRAFAMVHKTKAQRRQQGNGGEGDGTTRQNGR